MLKFIQILLLVVIYIAIGEWLILVRSGFNTAREFAEHLVMDDEDTRACRDRVINAYGEGGLRITIMLVTVLLVVTAPIVVLISAIKNLLLK